MNNESKTLLTVDQMCQLLNIGKNSAYKLLKTGEIQSFKIGRIWKIPKDSIDKYIAFYKK